MNYFIHDGIFLNISLAKNLDIIMYRKIAFCHFIHVGCVTYGDDLLMSML